MNSRTLYGPEEALVMTSDTLTNLNIVASGLVGWVGSTEHSRKAQQLLMQARDCLLLHHKAISQAKKRRPTWLLRLK
jgi:hypothetical protein